VKVWGIICAIFQEMGISKTRNVSIGYGGQAAEITDVVCASKKGGVQMHLFTRYILGFELQDKNLISHLHFLLVLKGYSLRIWKVF